MHYTITGTIQEIVASGSTFQESCVLLLFDGLIQFSHEIAGFGPHVEIL